MKKNDIKIIFVVIIISAVCFLSYKMFYSSSDKSELKVEITNKGKIIKTMPITKDKKIELDCKIVIQIKNKKVKVLYSPCKNQICVNHKSISKSGESIVCLPNNIIISIVGKGEEKQYDSIVR